MGTDKLPAVRAGAALNKSKLTTPPWPYLKYSFPTSPSAASIRLPLLLIPITPLSSVSPLSQRSISYSPQSLSKITTHPVNVDEDHKPGKEGAFSATSSKTLFNSTYIFTFVNKGFNPRLVRAPL